MTITVGERAERVVTLDAASIAAFATASGDANPLHHDPAYAAASRFGGLIASGTQTTALLLGLMATHFAPRGPSVGLGFEVTLRRAVPAGSTLRFWWEVARIEPKPSMGGDIIHLLGGVENLTQGGAALLATARALRFT